MNSNYLHVEVETAQSSKRPDMPCGDCLTVHRTTSGTVILCADGIGSGIRAHIAARMLAGRVAESLRQEFSLHRAFASCATTMQTLRDPERPFAAFTLAKIRTDGTATVLCYDAPPPVLVNHYEAIVPAGRPFPLDGGLATETHCLLSPGEGLLLMSDGITQAGIGGRVPGGWTIDGVVRLANSVLRQRAQPLELPKRIHRTAVDYWQRGGDDCTVALAYCRRGRVVNILTGPPADANQDATVVKRFMQADGVKIVCGGTTAEIVARHLRKPLDVDQQWGSLITPPRYRIEGVDLVTEGAVTLNQVYNLLEDDPAAMEEVSAVTEMCLLLNVADRINLIQGGARNSASDDISFRQRGVMKRDRLIPHLVAKLESAGKLVVVETV